MVLARAEYTISTLFDGENFYRAYADSADGSLRFSETESNRLYLGTYVGRTKPTKPSQYQWTLVKGADGSNGVSITSVDVEYAKNTSNTNPPTSGWTTTSPKWEIGSYIWQRVKTTYSVGNPTYSQPHCIETDTVNNITDYISSRGENLVTNGTGLMKNNTNFSRMVFDGTDNYGSSGSFKYTGGSTSMNSNELIPVDPNETYKMSYYIKENPYVGAKTYGLVSNFDPDGNLIQATHTMFVANTLTELAQDLKNGDTKIYLNNTTNWINTGQAGVATHTRKLIVWNYSNSYGYTYPPETYSRRTWGNLWDPGAINHTEKSITLRVPWASGTIAKGTKVSNGSDGRNYKYISGVNFTNPKEWTNKSGLIGGIDMSGQNRANMFFPGTSAVKVGWLLNREVSGGTTWLTNITFNKHVASQTDLDDTNQKVSKTVKTITEEYYQSTSATSQTGGKWTTVAPTWDANKFMFVRSKITYVDGTTSYTPEINLSGAKGDRGPQGPQGPQGIQGPSGSNGQSQWVHIRYSVNSNGSAMDTKPSSSTKYVGIAVTDSDKAPGYTEFTWSKYIGENGAPGEPGLPGKNGKDGTTTYTWIRYADEKDGTGINNFPAGKKFIGLAYNKTTPDESDNPNDYQWSAMYDEEAFKGIGLADKTEILSGTEIFTDKADDSVVHVEVDGKSYQDAGSGKNLFIPTRVIDGTMASQQIDNRNTLSPSGENEKFYEISGEPNKQYTFTFNYKHTQGQEPNYVKFFYLDETDDGKSQGALDKTTWTTKSITSKPNKTVIGIGYHNAEVEWIAGTLEEIIPFSRTVINDNTKLVSESYIRKNGVNGKKTYSIEYKWVNGVKTSESRNKKLTETINPINEEYVRGTMVVEWKSETYSEPIKFSRTTIDDKNVLPDESYIRKNGVNGERIYSIEYKWVNGVKTSESRNKKLTETINPINEEYVQGTMVVEWKQETSTETIAFTRVTQDNSDIYPNQSYVSRKGVDGSITYDLERKWVNGASTSETRNKVEESRENAVNEIYIRGTKTSEWRQVTTYESIPYTTVRQNDNTIEIGTEVVGTVGKDGRIKIITEHEYVNNSPTGEKREVSRVTDIAMIPEVIKVGTKPKALVNLLEPSKIKVPNALDIQINGARKPVQSVDSLDIPLELMQWATNPSLNIEGDAIQTGKEYTLAFKYQIKEGSVKNMKSTANIVWSNNKTYMDGELVSTRSDAEVPNGLWPTTPGVHTFVYQFGPAQASAGKLFMFRFNENHFTSPVKIWLTDIGLYEGHVQPFGEAGTPGTPETPDTPDTPDTDGLVPFRLEPDVAPSTNRTTIDAFANKRTYNLVTDFGAVGDGVTDNFTAMKNAILSSVSEPVNIIVPKGNFYYRGPDNARLEAWPSKSKGIRFIGQDGAVLLPDHNRTQTVHESYVMQLVFDEDTSIGFAMEGLTIDGINAPQDIYHTMPNATNVTVPTLRGISIEGAQDIVIHNSTFKNIFGGYTILATKYKQVDLSYVELDRCGGNAWTESFGGALYFGGQYGDATINIDNVHAEGYTDSRYPKLLGWIGIIFENGSVQLDNQSSWIKDQNTYFNITNSSFLNYETGWHIETVAGNTYWNSDNVLYKANNYAIVAALWGEIKEASNRIKTQLLPFGRTGIIKGMYYSEKEASKNENGLNDFKMYNSYVDVIDIPGFPSINQTMSYGDSVHSKYYNTTFNNVPNGLVANGSTTVVNSEINLAPGNPKTDYQLQNGEFSKPNVHKVSLTNTSINRGVAKIAAKGSNPAKVKNTGYTPPPLTKPLGPATLERES